jgi:hypothetical protein
MDLAFGEVDKRRQIPGVVQQGVDFEGPLGLSEGGPGKERQTEINHGGVEAEEGIFKSELVFRSLIVAGVQERGKVIFINSPGAFLIGLSQSGAMDAFKTKVVPIRRIGLEVQLQITQALLLGELGIEHGDKLGPAVEMADTMVSGMAVDDTLKFMSRRNFQQLLHDCVIMSHGLITPLFIGLLSTSIKRKELNIKPFFICLTGQQWSPVVP